MLSFFSSFSLCDPRVSHAILIASHTAWNHRASHFLSDTEFMEQYGWKICEDACLCHRCVLICIQEEGTFEAFKSHPRPLSSSTPSPWIQVPNQNNGLGWGYFPHVHQPVDRNRIWKSLEFEVWNQQNALAQSAANGINIWIKLRKIR